MKTTTPIHTRIIQDRTWHLLQVAGHNMQDMPFFMLVAVKDEAMQAFKQASQQSGFNPAQFGVVLGQGFLHEAPPLYRLEIIEKFNDGQWLKPS